MSGKTNWILQLLRHKEDMFTTRFNEIYYFLPSESGYSKDKFAKKLKEEFPFIKICFGLPTYSHISGTLASPLPKLFIIDDQMKELSQSQNMEKVRECIKELR
jgi:hypothetical protein